MRNTKVHSEIFYCENKAKKAPTWLSTTAIIKVKCTSSEQIENLKEVLKEDWDRVVLESEQE